MHNQRPQLSLIAAMAQNCAIGLNNSLPWHLPADLKHFKKLTVGKTILMGRNTWESLPGLLPNRNHIVLSRQRDYQAKGAEVAHTVDAAIAMAGDVEEIMVIGGGQLYQALITRADRIYLTLIKVDVKGDAFFPEIDASLFKLVRRDDHNADERNPYAYSFLTYERNQGHPLRAT